MSANAKGEYIVGEVVPLEAKGEYIVGEIVSLDFTGEVSGDERSVMMVAYDKSIRVGHIDVIVVEKSAYENDVKAGKDAIVSASALEAALDRSPYDISPCGKCGMPVVCIPEGLAPWCEKCAKEEEDEQ